MYATTVGDLCFHGDALTDCSASSAEIQPVPGRLDCRLHLETIGVAREEPILVGLVAALANELVHQEFHHSSNASLSGPSPDEPMSMTSVGFSSMRAMV